MVKRLIKFNGKNSSKEGVENISGKPHFERDK